MHTTAISMRLAEICAYRSPARINWFGCQTRSNLLKEFVVSLPLFHAPLLQCLCVLSHVPHCSCEGTRESMKTRLHLLEKKLQLPTEIGAPYLDVNVVNSVLHEFQALSESFTDIMWKRIDIAAQHTYRATSQRINEVFCFNRKDGEPCVLLTLRLKPTTFSISLGVSPLTPRDVDRYADSNHRADRLNPCSGAFPTPFLWPHGPKKYRSGNQGKSPHPEKKKCATPAQNTIVHFRPSPFLRGILA
ncbi:hypothetical protein [Cupriavidus sp. DF5525]|uniref:hypothetical protein n=1 Tax=Cupriavidus sp. DF5525 TaxID=3160989 RepID=UPI0032DF3229